MKTEFHRARGKLGPFAAGRLSLRHCHRMLTASIVALSLIVPLAVFEPAWPKEIEQARRQPKPSTCDRSQFRVILDVGHTVEAPGAISARNVSEYDFNLRLATYLEQSLIEDGFNKTVLLVTGGRARPSLFKRAAKANGLSANLLVSIHHDSVPDSLMESWEFEGKESHFSDRFTGHSIFVSYENPHLDRSLLFGRLLGNELKDRGLQYARQYTQPIMGRYQRELVDREAGVYRFDQLIVLRKTQMPAVLFEAGSIINREEELVMNSAERLDLISTSLKAAVRTFCNLTSPILRARTGNSATRSSAR
jgi:N-acetylmuramoyl-L-alanine amidase